MSDTKNENEELEETTGAEGKAEDDEAPTVAQAEGGTTNPERVCIACQRRKMGGKPYKHGHAAFCEKSIYFGLSAQQIVLLKEERSNKLKDTKENVLRRMGLSAKDTELKFPEISSTYQEVCGVPANLSAQHLSALVAANKANPSKAPRAVTVILRYLQMLAPNLKKGTNQVIQHEENIKKLNFFRSIFPRGCISFTVPKEDPTAKPNPDYRIAEGCTLLLVRWEFQTNEQLTCHFCKKGSLIPKKLSFSRTSVKPIIDIDGKLSWSVASTYRCTNCEISVQATDPDLIKSLPLWMQNAYPVEHNWINKVKTFQIGRRLAALIETIFIGEAYDGHFISYFLRKLYDSQYKRDYKLLVEACESHGEEGPKKDEWPFEKWTGDFNFPLGDFLREAFEFSRQGEKETQKMTDSPVAYLPPRPMPASPGSKKREGGGSGGPSTPSKRPARPEDYDDTLTPGRRPLPKVAAHPLASPPPPPPPQQPHGHPYHPPPARPTGHTLSPSAASMSPHTPTTYHQWPTYGPGPAFPTHYSPPHPRYPPPPGFSYGPPPNVQTRKTAPPASPAAPSEKADESPGKPGKL
mmetsp:Transcript_32814/g.49474  ORF Transcript_32814/g.49474 Transcript_32814/m.49474 type:complete len:578 (-) Transcript_32814:3173-4906(-)